MSPRRYSTRRDLRLEMEEGELDPAEAARLVCDGARQSQRNEWALAYLEAEARRMVKDIARQRRLKAKNTWRMWMEKARTEPDSWLRAMYEDEAARGATFKLPDGTEVTWGASTVDDHRVCLAALTGKKEAVEADMALHAWAIRQLERSLSASFNELAATLGAEGGTS